MLSLVEYPLGNSPCRTMTDEERTNVADDAVSNRSDDTALEEAAVAHVNGHGLVDESVSDRPVAAESSASEDAVAREDVDVSEGEADVDVAEEEATDVTESEDAEEETTQTEEEEDENSPAAIARRQPVELASEEPDDIHMDWYILKVQSNRERTIAEALERKMRIEGYDRYFDQVIVPTEKVTEFKGGKKKVVERKLYPGYIVVHMHINDDTWFAVRETSGVGDFTGRGRQADADVAERSGSHHSDRGRGNQRDAEARYPICGGRQDQGEGRQLRELRRGSRQDRRSQWSRNRVDSHLRPQYAGGIGVLAN